MKFKHASRFFWNSNTRTGIDAFTSMYVHYQNIYKFAFSLMHCVARSNLHFCSFVKLYTNICNGCRLSSRRLSNAWLLHQPLRKKNNAWKAEFYVLIQLYSYITLTNTLIHTTNMKVCLTASRFRLKRIRQIRFGFLHWRKISFSLENIQIYTKWLSWL